MANNLNVGVVGAGYAGKLHLNVLKKIKNVQIQTICDLNQGIISQLAKEYRVPTYYTNFNTMLDEENLDFITICTPPKTHAPLSIKAIKSGLHVLIEKPFTETSKEALDIVNTLKSTGNNVKVGVVHNVLFYRVVQQGLEIIRRGEIGRLLNLIIIRTSPFDRDPFISNKNHWVHKIPGGRVCECIPHQIYTAQEFMDNPKVRDVSAKKFGSAPWVSFDEVNVILESDSAFGSIYWSRNTSKFEDSIYLIGSKGTLKIELQSGTIIKIRGSSEQKRKSKSGKLDQIKEPIQYTLSESRQLLSSLIDYHGRLFLHRCGIRQAYLSPHDICLRSFVDNIINDQEPYVNAQKGYDCIRVVEEICTYLQNINRR